MCGRSGKYKIRLLPSRFGSCSLVLLSELQWIVNIYPLLSNESLAHAREERGHGFKEVCRGHLPLILSVEDRCTGWQEFCEGFRKASVKQKLLSSKSSDDDDDTDSRVREVFWHCIVNSRDACCICIRLQLAEAMEMGAHSK